MKRWKHKELNIATSIHELQLSQRVPSRSIGTVPRMLWRWTPCLVNELLQVRHQIARFKTDYSLFVGWLTKSAWRTQVTQVGSRDWFVSNYAKGKKKFSFEKRSEIYL